MIRYLMLLTSLLLLPSCQSSPQVDEALNLEAEIIGFSTEAADLRSRMEIERTAVAATVDAAFAQADTLNRYNDQLRATVVVVVPPTPAERQVFNDIQGPLPVEVYDLSNGEMRFVQVGPAGQIDGDGCFLAKQQFFPQSIGAIYMTAVALNLRAGTLVRVDWQYGNEIVLTSTWTAPQSQDYRCIAIAMRPNDVEFSPGNWTATLSVNGEPVDPRSFTIISG